MKFLVITDDATRADLEDAIRHLRDRQAKACIPSTRDEIADEIDELLEAWSVAT